MRCRVRRVEPATPPPSAYVLAQTGPGSAFSAGSPTEEPLRSEAEAAKSVHSAPTAPASSAPAAKVEPAPEPSDPRPRTTKVPVAPLTMPTYAATDYRPRGVVEKDLCARASSPDYAYIAGTVALTAGALMFETYVGKKAEQPFWRTASTGLVGLSFGTILGGGYLSLPKCSPDFVPPVQPEGDLTARWPLALAIALASSAAAPFLVWISTGGLPQEWAMSERGSRIYVPALSGALGALLPWIPAIAPKTYRNMLKLERLRLQGAPVPPGASSAADGAMLGYAFSF